MSMANLAIGLCVCFAFSTSAPIDEESQYFSEKWRATYEKRRLAVQPAWKLADDQPVDNSYEVRDYEPAWWVTSYTPCMNRTISVGYGYLNLYLYVNKYNYQRFKYPPTYPVLTKVEVDNGLSKSKDRNECPNRYSQSFYLPLSLDKHPATTPDETITTEILPARRFFVRQYYGGPSPKLCDQEAGNLATSLALNGKQFGPFTWYCAWYEPGKSGKKVFEVWMEEIEQEPEEDWEED